MANSGQSGSTRLSVNLNNETAAILGEYESRGDSATHTVNRAIAVLAFIDAEIRAGHSIRVVNYDSDTYRELNFL